MGNNSFFNNISVYKFLTNIGRTCKFHVLHIQLELVKGKVFYIKYNEYP